MLYNKIQTKVCTYLHYFRVLQSLVSRYHKEVLYSTVRLPYGSCMGQSHGAIAGFIVQCNY